MADHFATDPFRLTPTRIEWKTRFGRNLPYLLFLTITLLWLLLLSGRILISGTPGFSLTPGQQGLTISRIDHTLNEVEAGDLITVIAGNDYNRVLGYPFIDLAADRPGDPFIITVQRGGNLLHIRIHKQRMGIGAFLLDTWPNLVLILALSVPPFLGILLAPADQPANLFFFAFLSMALVIVNQLTLHFGLLEPRLLSLSMWGITLFNWVGFSVMTHFILQFPAEHQLLKGRPWAVAIIYLLPPLGAIAGSLVAAGVDPEFFGWLQRLRRWSVPLLLLLTLGKLIQNFFNASSPLVRNQLKWPVASLCLGFCPYLFFYLLPSLLLNRPLVHFQVVILFATLIPVAFFLAMIRYRLLEIDTAITSTLTYFILIGLIAALYAALVTLVGGQLQNGDHGSEAVILLYLLLIAFLFNPLRNRIQGMVDRYYYRDPVDLFQVVHRFSRQIGTAIQLRELARLLVRELPEAFRLEKACLVVQDGEARRIYPEEQDTTAVPPSPGAIAGLLAGTQDLFLAHPWFEEADLRREAEVMLAGGFVLTLGLKSGESFLGMLLLGSKRSGGLFTARELQICRTLANQAAVALENAMRYEALERSRVQLQEMFGRVIQSKKLADIGEMTAVLAHEIRNPLSIIRSAAQLIDTEGKSSREEEELIRYILEGVDSLDRIVSNLLGLARYTPPQLAPVRMERLLQRRIREWRQSTDHRATVEITLEMDSCLPEIQADEKQITQVVFNLLRNAEEMMPEGGRIAVVATGAKDGGVAVRVHDNGEGLSKEAAAKVFDKFFTTKEKGLGLGLSICRQIVEAHGGTLRLEPNADRGATATLQLPFDPRQVAIQPGSSE